MTFAKDKITILNTIWASDRPKKYKCVYGRRKV